VLKNRWLWGIAAASFLAIFAVNIAFPVIVVIAACIGYFGSHYAPAAFELGGGHSASKKTYGAALIDDYTPTPKHAMFSKQTMLKVLAIGVALWGVMIGGLTFAFGLESALTQMAWFFTKAALMTFGGAYAVLPYVTQGAVDNYHWLNATQMMDGLALGETTPGPLIIVVAFVGFIGGWTQSILGTDSLFLSGALAACVVTAFTFLPSFIFILAGGPFIESTKNNIKFTAPLTAITAAVVGVILNLALYFAYHVLWEKGWAGSFNWASAVILVMAGLALFRFKLGVLPLLAACATLGLAFKWII
jgi:chromate transporter